MKTNYIEPFFNKFISSWFERIQDYYSNSTFVLTDKGEMPIHSFLSEEKRNEFCNEKKEQAFKSLNTAEKEMYLNTYDKVYREKMNLSSETYMPSSLSYLPEQSLEFLECQKIYLLNQIFEIETIISMKKKLEDKTDSNNLDDETDWANN